MTLVCQPACCAQYRHYPRTALPHGPDHSSYPSDLRRKRESPLSDFNGNSPRRIGTYIPLLQWRREDHQADPFSPSPRRCSPQNGRLILLPLAELGTNRKRRGRREIEPGRHYCRPYQARLASSLMNEIRFAIQ